MRTTRCPASSSRSNRNRLCGERGAILVHVAVAFAGLVAFSALSIDLGVLWVARTQAQNAADAASLAAAVSLAYGDPVDALAKAEASATAVASANPVWGTPVPFTSTDFAEVPCPPGSPSTAGPGTCVSAAIRRVPGNGDSLPILFARLFGASAPSVRATSVAKVVVGNSSNCVRPLAIADRWTDNRDIDAPIDFTWTFEDVFERYQPGLPGVLLPAPVDEYLPPTPTSTGSGYRMQDVIGQEIALHRGEIDNPRIEGDHFYSLDLPRVGGTIPGDTAQYSENFTSCTGLAVAIGDTVQTMYVHQDVTADAVAALVAQDPSATWNGTAVVGSGFSVSPRIVPVVLYDPDEFSQVPTPIPPPYRTALRVRNIVGLFIERFDGLLYGVFVPLAGNFDPDQPTITQDASFLRTVALVR